MTFVSLPWEEGLIYELANGLLHNKSAQYLVLSNTHILQSKGKEYIREWENELEEHAQGYSQLLAGF